MTDSLPLSDAYTDLERILQLKQTRPNTSTAIDLQDPRLDSLRQDRADAWQLTHNLVDELVNGESGSIVVQGFADVAALARNDPGLTYARNVDGTRYLVRAEETLESSARDVARRVQDRLSQQAIGRFALAGDTVIRNNIDGSSSTIRLNGYTYNRSGNDPGERIHFSDFPSCDTLLAAGALAQLAIAERVVRIIPASMKSREYAARDILVAAGHDELPVISVAVGSSGNIQSIVPWSKGEQLADVRHTVRQLRHHQTDRSAA